MADRTKEQIIEQALYAVACVAKHYGPGFSGEGLLHVKSLLEQINFWADGSYMCDVNDDDTYADFEARIIWPNGWHKLEKAEMLEDLREEEDYHVRVRNSR